jgi:hypothetical protein
MKYTCQKASLSSETGSRLDASLHAQPSGTDGSDNIRRIQSLCSPEKPSPLGRTEDLSGITERGHYSRCEIVPFLCTVSHSNLPQALGIRIQKTISQDEKPEEDKHSTTT